MATVIEVSDVTVSFGGVRAVDGLSLQLREGVFYGLIGPNGSGKSTLLSALSRLVEVSEGRLLFRGHEYQSSSRVTPSRFGIARTFQTVRLLPQLSVLENVMCGADLTVFGPGIVASWLLPRWAGRRERRCREVAQSLLDTLGLREVGERHAGELPYGTQRRVEIARALASRPSVLLLDEPVAGMSSEERDDIGGVLKSVARGGVTCLLVEHDVPLVSRICDELIAMNNGRIIASGTPQFVVSHPLVQEAYLGVSPEGCGDVADG
jgi:branched-chain amino acid transport system ATP-binding protein